MLDLATKRLFLLTSVEKKGRGIGALFLNDLASGTANVNFFWFTVKSFLSGERLMQFGKLGRAIRSLLVRLSFWQSLRILIFRKVSLRRLVDRIECELKTKKLDTILLTTSSPELIAVGRQLVESGWRVVPIVWDDPDYLGRNLRFSTAQQEKMLLDFEILMGGACASGVISEEMKDRYSQRYQVPCQIVRHGTKQWGVRRDNFISGAIKVVFAGSLYSKDEWNSFVDALDNSNWICGGRPIELTFIGAFPLIGAKKPQAMRHIPHVPNSMVLDLMQEHHIGYLPYWFDPKFEVVARTSFPGKMTSYAAAGLMIFHHAPAYSSVKKFIDRYPFGVCCSSCEFEVVHADLKRLISMLETSSAIDAREDAMREELSNLAMDRAFEDLLKLAERNIR